MFNDSCHTPPLKNSKSTPCPLPLPELTTWTRWIDLNGCVGWRGSRPIHTEWLTRAFYILTLYLIYEHVKSTSSAQYKISQLNILECAPSPSSCSMRFNNFLGYGSNFLIYFFNFVYIIIIIFFLTFLLAY